MPKPRKPFSNKLTPAEVERLAILVEEASEVIQIAMKILRHGYGSYHPSGSYNNRHQLERECGDLRFALLMMVHAGDLSKEEIHLHAESKGGMIEEYLHHQEDALINNATADAR